MAISNTLSSIITNLSNAYSQIGAMGGTIPLSKNMENLPSAIGTIPSDMLVPLWNGVTSELNSDNITTVPSYACYYNSGLTNVSLPNATTIGTSAFAYCSELSSVYLGTNCASINQYAFACRNSATLYPHITIGGTSSSIASAYASLSYIGTYAFSNCSVYILVSTPYLYIGNSAFRNAAGYLYLNSPSVAGLGTSVFTGLFRVYIPTSMVSAYRNNASWSTAITNGQVSVYGTTFPE